MSRKRSLLVSEDSLTLSKCKVEENIQRQNCPFNFSKMAYQGGASLLVSEDGLHVPVLMMSLLSNNATSCTPRVGGHRKRAKLNWVLKSVGGLG